MKRKRNEVYLLIWASYHFESEKQTFTEKITKFYSVSTFFALYEHYTDPHP